ncbi:type II CAAX endopeptidase family protein [Pullulanibacillus sp. KACC 23026]|uniref:CPBP family intramembrane glutamic endopeptidase n=1 Tax=Pullulanibacillus sp. KACC 23026 TaxID=3028315 RepID=UPI0023B1D48B|nr:type II CAAX endopeptidase family protein [Pullulanibacillus sp. KACC 23026]WEG12501.1 type II CAAX endopeptidase family protein [Pullulanibacillus sp. KACC 23026]
MLKRYIMIIIVYVLCQLSGFLALTPILSVVPKGQREGFMISLSFIVCLVLTLLILMPERHIKRPYMEPSTIVSWIIGGIFLVYLTQMVAGIIDYNLFGSPAQSQNTEDIMKLARQSPYIILSVVVIGPILEEIIFRKIIFGSLNRFMPFFFAAVISSLLFALAHADGHLIIYGSIGFALAFLYHKTKRIYVSMFAHGSLNAIATILALSPHVQKFLEQHQPSWIGWWF